MTTRGQRPKTRRRCRLTLSNKYRRWLAVYTALQSLTVLVFHLNLSQLDNVEWLRKAGFVTSKTSFSRHPSEEHWLVSEQAMRNASIAYIRSFPISLHQQQRPLKFLHIPKTAGTAIETAAGEKWKIPWGSCLFHHKPKRPVCHYPKHLDYEWPRYIGWWHLPPQLFPLGGLLPSPYANAELFAVVRPPLERAVSEFYYLCTLKALSWRPNPCHRTRLFDPTYLNEWIQDKMQQNLQKKQSGTTSDYYLMDNGHFTPQYEFLVGPGDVRRVDFVLTLNDGDGLQDDFSRLMTAFDLSRVQLLKKQNALGAKDRDSEQHLTVADLDETTVHLMRQAYAADFGLFSNV